MSRRLAARFVLPVAPRDAQLAHPALEGRGLDAEQVGGAAACRGSATRSSRAPTGCDRPRRPRSSVLLRASGRGRAWRLDHQTWSLGDDQRAFHHVPQLAYVARPRVRSWSAARLSFEMSLDAFPERLGVFPRRTPRRAPGCPRAAPAAAEPGSGTPSAGSTVLAKRTTGDLALEVLVGRGHDPDVDLVRMAASQSVDRRAPAGRAASWPAVSSGSSPISSRNIVAPCAISNHPSSARRPGIGAPLVTEQLAFDERRRNRAHS